MKVLILGYLDLYMSHVMRNPTMWFTNRSDTKPAVQAQRMAGAGNFTFRKKRIHVAKTKAHTGFPVMLQKQRC